MERPLASAVIALTAAACSGSDGTAGGGDLALSRESPAARGSRTVTLLLAGDVMTGRGVDQIFAEACDPVLREPAVDDARTYVELAEAAHGPVPRPVGPEYVWGEALGLLTDEDPAASIVNLETSVTTSDAFWPRKAVHYRMHPRNAACLTAARIDVCAVANNHVMDFGREGLAETIATLARAGVRHAGAGRDLAAARCPARVELAGGGALLVFAFGAGSSGIPPDWAAGPSTPGVDLVPEISTATADEVVARVRAERRPGDVVVASIHWGDNWGHDVPAEHVAFAHRLVEGGVDVVHGHSSHHVRPVEVHAGKLVLYGCGDLVDDYEGITGHESWRSDLSLMYFATVSAADGTLVALRMRPVQMRRMRLVRTSHEDAKWLAATLDRISGPLGTHVDLADDGTLRLRAAPRSAARVR